MKNKKFWVSLLAGFLAVVMLLSLVVGVIPLLVGAEEWDDKSSSEMQDIIDGLEDEKKEIKDQIKELKKQIKDNMSEMQKIVAQKDVIDQEIALMYQQIDLVNEQIRAYGLLIADKQAELERAQTRYTDLNTQYKARIRAMEEEGEISYWSVLFKASSFSDLLDRLNMIEEIAAADQRRLKQLNEAAEQVAKAQQILTLEKQALEGSKEELLLLEEDLQIKRAEADELLMDLNALGEEFEAQIAAGEDEVEALLQQIAKAEDAYDAAKDREYQQWLSTSVPPTTKPKPSSGGSTTPPAPNPGGWVMPCRYSRVSSPYGWRIHPVYKIWKFHSGIDLAASSGTPIYASRSGKVTVAKYDKSAGNYVTINHGDGFSTSYLHMTHDVVEVGEYVSAGQLIGYVGSTGVSTGAHLHFTMYYKGETVNPADYINFG